MPNYFADYDTTVHFISMDELERDHKGIPHGGMGFRSGVTGFNHEKKHIIGYLKIYKTTVTISIPVK